MADYRDELAHSLGDAFTSDPDLCSAYDHDLGEMPGVLLMLFRRKPSGVALPRSVEQVRTALSIAHAHGVPVTPRAQASSGYGGTMPTCGGLVVDVSRMRAILSVDSERMTCDVEPGVVWTDLDEALAPMGLASVICPTSGPSSTVGGMFAMGGMGIGSFRYGDILDCIEEIDVVHPDGSLHTVVGEDLATYAFSQGTLGVIVRLRLRLRKAAELRKIAVHMPSPESLQALLVQARVYGALSVSLLSSDYLDMQAQAAPGGSSWAHGPIAGGFLALLVFDAAFDEAAFARALAVYGCTVLDDEHAEHEWAMRFYPMRIKRNGPALLVGEYVVSSNRFAEVCQGIRRRMKHDTVGFEAFVNRNGEVAVLIYVQDSADDLLSLMRMGKAMVPLHVAAAAGGHVYASGLWFNSQTTSVIGRERSRRLTALKKRIDPKGRMNPGKCCGTGFGFLPFRLLSWGIWIGTYFMGPLSCVLNAKPRRIGGDH